MVFEHTISLRVRYAETDQMGYVYYGNYAIYYEVARVECIRALGCSYKSLEEDGILLPVYEHYSKFIAPARYDEILTIKTRIKEKPTSSRIQFEYEIFNENGKIINIGSTTLVFVNKQTGRPCLVPDRISRLFDVLS
ncbi:MAG: acyl-CoA thioesterase [Cytophagales bacterium]|nr:acyl-CoA thioesterase [Cytophagales bacterium]MDW8384171.1 thioesterase family protein [Flammeovirgaceae bacterium]